MRKLIILLAFLGTSATYAASVTAKGQFTSKPGDTLSFIKKQLYANTVRNVLDSELQKLGLDRKTFWQNYETKFEEHFAPIKENYDQKFGAVDEEGNPVQLSAAQKDRYDRGLRYKKLTSQASYGKFNSIITSYAIKKMSKSLSRADTHYITINAKVNRKLVSEIYYRFIGTGKNRTFSRLYLNINYKLNDLTWEEVGVSSKSKFTDVVEEHWLQELSASVGGVFLDGIEVVNPSTRQEIYEHLKQPLAQLREGNDTAIFGSRQNELRNSLMMNLDITLSKEYKDEKQQIINIKTFGGFVLTDLRDGAVVTFTDFAPASQEYSTKDPHKQSSEIASFVYQLPISEMKSLKRTVKEKVSIKNSFEIVLKNTKNINEAFDFAGMLKEEGVVYFFDPQISATLRNVVNITITFSGDKDKAMEVLEKFKTVKLGDEAIVKRDDTLPFVFNVIHNNESPLTKKVESKRQ
ncbi:hypothetical protein [Halobacteriovorax sp.]|uniref:hypothetical protein n=1 Tax=Halobacteriovorax sp. TaxID=2020862 RepID=UPI003AF2A13E